MGVVRFEAHRGYFLATDAEDLTALKLLVNEEGDEDESYFELAEDRLAGKLPQQVTENELMRRYKLPRGRLVKILNRIAQEGWIERLPGHGWEFRQTLTSRHSYEAGYRFRATIESAAVLEPTSGSIARLSARHASNRRRSCKAACCASRARSYSRSTPSCTRPS